MPKPNHPKSKSGGHTRPPLSQPSPRTNHRPHSPRLKPGAPLNEVTREAPLDDHARHAVFRVLVRQSRLYPDFDLGVLDRTIDAEKTLLDERDRAFAHAIYDATVRHWITLEYLIQRSLTQPWSELEPRLKATLLAGSTQMLFMDKVPVHSAINHAVEWAKRIIRPGAGAFANAVLRKVAALRVDGDAGRRPRYSAGRDEIPTAHGGAIVLAEPVLPEDELERLAIATSHPIGLLRHWLRRQSMRDVRHLAMHTVCHAPVILNTAHAKSPPPPDAAITPHEAPGHHVFTGSAAALHRLLDQRPDVWVQDPSSALAVQGVADLRPSLILDLCAGQGTKTRQLAATFPNAKIIATDIDQPRFARLQETFKHSQQVSVLPAKPILDEYRGKADLILLDVPCSNTGVLARRPEARYRFDDKHLKQITDLQKQIIADAIPLLAEHPRGKILYSTCSLEVEENQQHAAWADHWHRLGVSRERARKPTGQPGDPPHLYSDGSFSALLG